jgi:RNA-binding protein Musashi
MRDGPTGRSRGFGFLTFKDPKTVNIVMVKEHYLDGKIVRLHTSCHYTFSFIILKFTMQIDPKRAIPRDEQEKTSKIFVGGVSQEATETDFREYFMQFGRVLDATLMMDKDTGRPRGFGFVTFDSESAVENALNCPTLEIMGKQVYTI